jgi:protoheme IX farnesyltransferase
MGITGLASLIVALICGFFFMLKGFQLAIDLQDSSAKKLMFASFIYLPIVLISFVLDKI